MSGALESAAAAVLVKSDPLPEDAISIEGPDFNKNFDLQSLLKSYSRIGFQASGLATAIDIVNNMVR